MAYSVWMARNRTCIVFKIGSSSFFNLPIGDQPVKLLEFGPSPHSVPVVCGRVTFYLDLCSWMDRNDWPRLEDGPDVEALELHV